MSTNKYHWHRYTARESFERLLKGANHWVCHGDFLNDWYRSDREDRLELVVDPLSEPSTEREQQWAALFAASVEQLCANDGLEAPAWTEWHKLAEPWFPTVKSENMKKLYQEVTPLIYKKHNVFAGDKVLDKLCGKRSH